MKKYATVKANYGEIVCVKRLLLASKVESLFSESRHGNLVIDTTHASVDCKIFVFYFQTWLSGHRQVPDGV